MIRISADLAQIPDGEDSNLGTAGLQLLNGPQGGGDSDVQQPPQEQAPTPTIQPAQAAPAPGSASSPAMAPPNSPHAGLRNMIMGMMVGLDSFASSAATQGREGGVQEVQAFQQKQKEMQLKQKAAQEQSEDHALRMKTGVADYNMKQAQLAQFVQEMPLKHQKLSDAVQESTLDLLLKKGVPLRTAVEHVEGQSTDAHVAAVGTAANGDFTGNYAIPTYGPNGAGKGGGKTTVVDAKGVMGMTVKADDVAPGIRALQGVIDQASTELGPNDPTVKVAKGKLDFVKSGLASDGTMDMPHWLSLTGMNTELQSAMSRNKQTVEMQTKQADLKQAQQKADPLFKMENDPGEMAGEKSTAAIPLLQNKLSNPETSPEDKVRATRLLAQAKSAHQNFINDQRSKANAEQAAKQGDPAAAGKMLADGILTLTDLKTRGMTPDFIVKTVTAAKVIDPKYNPADEIIAEQVAKSPAQTGFFGNANSLIQKGGTLDQLKDAGDKLPNAKLPIFNKVSDFVSAASGQKELPGYTATLLGVSDDYSKVMGGGQGSDASRMQVYNSFAASMNSGQRQSAIDAARKAVGSQVESRIGNNKFLKRAYGYALPSAQAAPFDPKTELHPIQ